MNGDGLSCVRKLPSGRQAVSELKWEFSSQESRRNYSSQEPGRCLACPEAGGSAEARVHEEAAPIPARGWSCCGAMEFSQLLFVISEALDRTELASLKFLSLEHVTVRKREDIEEPKAFFQALQEKGMIEVGDLFFLKELLYRINRIDLLASYLGSSREEMERELQVPGKAKVSAYR